MNEDGDKEMDVISISQALQIAGEKCFFLWYNNLFYQKLTRLLIENF